MEIVLVVVMGGVMVHVLEIAKTLVDRLAKGPAKALAKAIVATNVDINKKNIH